MKDILVSVSEKNLTKLGTVFASAFFVYIILRLVGFHRLFADDAVGAGMLLEILGTVYSVLLAFTIFAVWQQYNSVEKLVLDEMSALDDAVFFGKGLPREEWPKVKRALKTYLTDGIEDEWKRLGKGRKSEKSERMFSKIKEILRGIETTNQREEDFFTRLLDTIGRANTARDERLAMSTMRIPRTLFYFVGFLAISILALMFLYPFSNWFLGLVSLIIAAAVFLAANFVVTDMDNPFQGAWNISNDPFKELAKKIR